MTGGSSSFASANSRHRLRSSRKRIFKGRRRSSGPARRTKSMFPKPVPPKVPAEDSVIRRTSIRIISDFDSMSNRRRLSSLRKMKAGLPFYSCPSNKKTSGNSCRPKFLSGQIRGPVQVDLENLLPYESDVINGCAFLAIQNHSIRNLQNWHHWRILKIVKALKIRVSGFIYYLTFQADKANENGDYVQHTFEAHVWSGQSERRVNGIRTIDPPSDWYPGDLWIPLTRPLPQPHELVSNPRSPAELEELRTAVEDPRRRSSRLMEYNQLVPPKIYGRDLRASYNKQSNELAKKNLENTNQSKAISKKSDEEDILTLGSEPVKLDLANLSDSDLNLEDCATLAMQDHLIQTVHLDWRDWRLCKIEKTLKICLGDGGCNYFITFQAEKGNHVRTLDAEVWDHISQRRVKRFMTLKPRITEWYLGKLWIPI